jgi:chemotaxis methyl-accepting protein methylase
VSKRAGRTREPHGRKILRERGLDLGSFKEPFVILCRDALICIAREAQRKVFEVFSRVLRSGGYLVLGKTETISPAVKRRFTLVDMNERAYQKPVEASAFSGRD